MGFIQYSRGFRRFRQGKNGFEILAFCFLISCAVFAGETDKTTLVYGRDTNIKMVVKGRAANLELDSSDTEGEGQALTDYQKGSGYVSYDRASQELQWRSRIGYTLNRLSKHIVKVAPYMRVEVPKLAELDLSLNVNSLGYGSLDFTNLNISRLRFDVNYGDVDISFPTENRSIVRGAAKIHLMTGDLEINQLANLRATEVRINGGVGEVTIDFGPKLLQEMDVRLDHDIGSLELRIPRGTRTELSGTARDLGGFGFEKKGNHWISASFHPDSPLLRIRMKGPVGELNVVWY